MCVCLPAHFGDVFWPQGEAHLYFSPLAAWRQHPVPLFQHPTSLRHQPGSPIIIVIILAATPASSAPCRRIPAGDIPPPPVPNRAGIKIFSGSYVCVGDTGWGGGGGTPRCWATGMGQAWGCANPGGTNVTWATFPVSPSSLRVPALPRRPPPRAPPGSRDGPRGLMVPQFPPHAQPRGSQDWGTPRGAGPCPRGEPEMPLSACGR